MEKKYIQPFNYHTHTLRCGHATNESVEEYILSARKNGLSSIGFTCHVPNNIYEYQDYKYKMNISEVGDYIREIKELKEKYTDIDIKVGFEAEYSIDNSELLCSLKDEVDYMILGQHEVKGAKIDGSYPLVYASSVCAAMQSGLFDIVAHPDVFLTIRKKISEEEQSIFDTNTVEATRRICSVAKDLSIPLEINIRGFVKKQPFPSSDFFKMCALVGNPVLFGCDAHSKEEIDRFQNNINDCYEYLSIDNLKFVLNNYDPVEARKVNNLNNLYINFKRSSRTYKYYMSKRIVEGLLHDIDSNNFTEELKNRINEINRNEENVMVNQIEVLSKTYDISSASESLINRIKEIILPGIHSTCEARKVFYSELVREIEKLKQYNIKDRSVFSDLVCKIIECNNTKNDNNKNILEKDINGIIKMHLEETLGGNEKGTKKVLADPHYKSRDDEEVFNGFTNIAIVALIVSFIVGFGIGIAYMLISLK